jgi:hypothetical protein
LRDSGNSIGKCGASLRRFRAVTTIAGFVAGDEDPADAAALFPSLAGRPIHQSAPQRFGGPAPPLMLLRRQIGHVAEPRLPLDGDDRRLLVIVGGRGGVMRRRNNSCCLARRA